MKSSKQKTKNSISSSSLIVTTLLFVMIITISLFTYYRSQGIDLTNIKILEMFSVKTIKNSGDTASAANTADIASVANTTDSADTSDTANTADTAKEQKLIKEFSYEPAEHPVFSVYKENIVKCTQDYVRAIDRSGNEIWTINIAMNAPTIKTNGKQLLIADIGGRNVVVIEGEKIKWNIKNDNDIINADISKSGIVTIIQMIKGYRSRVAVYDKLGLEVFHRDLAEDNIFSSIVSPNNKYIVVNGINAMGISVIPVVKLLDIEGKQLEFHLQIKDQILPFSSFMGDEALFLAGEKNLYFYSSGWKQKWTYDIGNLESCGIVGDKIIVSSEVKTDEAIFNKGASMITIYNKKGNQINSFKLEQVTKNIKTHEEIAAINTGDAVVFIDSNGDLKGKYSSNKDIVDIFFFNKSEVLVITKAKMEIVRIN